MSHIVLLPYSGVNSNLLLAYASSRLPPLSQCHLRCAGQSTAGLEPRCTESIIPYMARLKLWGGHAETGVGADLNSPYGPPFACRLGCDPEQWNYSHRARFQYSYFCGVVSCCMSYHTEFCGITPGVRYYSIQIRVVKSDPVCSSQGE